MFARARVLSMRAAGSMAGVDKPWMCIGSVALACALVATGCSSDGGGDDASVTPDPGVEAGGGGGPAPECAADDQCTSPPAAECADSAITRVWLSPGLCVEGVCEYTSVDTICNTGPADSCESETVARRHTAACVEGKCEYTARIEPCEDPPDPSCKVGNMLEVPAVPGACSNGRCKYERPQIACGELGCCDTTKPAHCCELRPVNAETIGVPEMTGADVDFDGTFDTDADCAAGSALGECAAVTAAPLDICVCRADSVRLGNVRITGSRPLALLAWDSIAVEGTVDLSADGEESGPGAFGDYDEEAGADVGAAGGSHATGGGPGGGAGGNLGASPKPGAGSPTGEPLRGGMRGQSTCQVSGGGGGGALQLASRGSVTVSGVIDAGGGGAPGGWFTDGCLGGSGGGAGGLVVIEGLEVTITGTIAANGGGGSGAGHDLSGGTGGAGADATPDTTAASGGQGADGFGCDLFGFTVGGDGGPGGVGDVAPGEGQPGDEASGCDDPPDLVGGGGGGGSVGRIRINAASGCDCEGGTFSPEPSLGEVDAE